MTRDEAIVKAWKQSSGNRKVMVIFRTTRHEYFVYQGNDMIHSPGVYEDALVAPLPHDKNPRPVGQNEINEALAILAGASV